MQMKGYGSITIKPYLQMQGHSLPTPALGK